MAARICVGCDYYKPQFFRLIGRECAAFRTCVTEEACGMRAPSLPRDASGGQMVPGTEEPQSPAELKGA
ncbi:MAG: hypothetical protein PHY64_00390 [Eubacteriales bacterium]|nr:hypothetical protein [Eubacteriales bacterium]